MGNPFNSADMAAGYAGCRPPVHRRVIERVMKALGRTERFGCGLDVGCGAGVSTGALEGTVVRRIGLEPAESMLQWVSATAPGAQFVVAVGEAIPLVDHSVDLITAAGSLNYANPDLFFPEALRVLTAAGVLVVYDFSAGSSFTENPDLEGWFSDFQARYPPAVHEARQLDPDILAAFDSGFSMGPHERFQTGITLTPDFYLNYILTETNVAAAVRAGAALSEIRRWCGQTLAHVWQGREHEVLFRGYYACLLPLPAQPQGE